jgi:hypothetical protein
MFLPVWVLTGSQGMWAADCLVSGCLWTTTASGSEAADAAALTHTATQHPEHLVPEELTEVTNDDHR